MLIPSRFVSAPELAVLEASLPEGLTESMRELAVCLFEAIVIMDERAGCRTPAGPWLDQLQAWVAQVLAQLSHLSQELGGRGGLYIAKGLVAKLSVRDREMCTRFRGDNYRQLATEYGLTEMRVRQIVDADQRERFAARQGLLPGL